MTSVRALRLSTAAAVVALTAHGALAAGFGIEDRSASQLGTANAGAAAAAEDASTIADNPAGIARLSGTQFVGAGTFINPYLQFRNDGSTFPNGAPINGRNDDGASFAPVPSFFFSSAIGGGLAAGLGLFSSFGLATNYRPNWVGRYLAQSTELTSLDFAPTLAYQVLPNLAVGVSPVARYTKVKIATAIDFGAIGAGAGIPGAAPGSADGSVKAKAHDWSFGFNGGILFEPTDTTRLGFAYFHSDAANLTGSGRFGRPTLGNIIAATTGTFVDSDTAAVIALPDHLNLGLVQKLSPELDLRLGFSWTQWSSFNEERITFRNPLQPDALTNENWRDTVTVSVGGSYRLTPDLVLRAGLGYDQTPIPDPPHRDPRLPDASRIEAAIGAGYQLTAATSVDVAYEHLFGIGNAKTDMTTATGDHIVGTTRLSADIFAVQLTVRY
jgi:long-chain fatty acid transport protein